MNPYKKAGVDVEAGDEFADWIASSKLGQKHFRSEVLQGVGGFASLFRLPSFGFKDPCLVSCTDGVGTKVKLAAQYERFDSVGQDLVAMCANDLICLGATPLFFLDYYATGKLVPEHAKTFLTGVQKACDEARMALVGGETAEMPGVYQGLDFDCAGFAVGVVDRSEALGAERVVLGDVVLGISSSGFHSNGYSLLRKVFANDLDNWFEKLLVPTALYPELVYRLQQNKVELHGIAHITGGGIENLPRVLPTHLAYEWQAWPIPEMFLEVAERAQMSRPDLLRTFNCGMGLMIVLPGAEVKKVQETAQELGFKSLLVGQIVERREPGQAIVGL